MHKDKPIVSATAIVFSASLDARNYLREQVDAFGLNAVCFEKEAICFDNFKSIQPKIVIAETDLIEVVWRFIFALHASRVPAPLVIVSNHQKDGWFRTKGLPVTVHSVAMNRVGKLLFKKLAHLADNLVSNDEHASGARQPLLVGQSDAVLNIRSMLPGIVKARGAVLIVGEPGTGKELLARLIVAMSHNEKTFIKIDCRELKPELLVNGWFQAAIGNGNKAKPATIFLDHVDQMSPISQAEMRMLIETSRKSLNGEKINNRNNIRFVASSGKHIESLVEKGAFRKDLFYRLNVIPVDMPALRDRKDDIPLLMDYFTIEACSKMKKCVMVPSQQVREMLCRHTWPGNVKELQNQMWRVAETGSEKCLYANTNMPKVRKDTREYLFNVLGKAELPKSSEIKNFLPAIQNMSLKGICDEFVSKTERNLMKKALDATSWNRRKAAQLLNISYKSMLNKMKAYDI
jgi:DNA-binding NtrC family response regulator